MRARKSNKLLALLLCVMLVMVSIPTTAYAATVVSTYDMGDIPDTVTGTLYDDGLFEISGTGRMKSMSSSTESPLYTQNTKITRIKIDEGITSIGHFTIYVGPTVTSLEIPEGVTTLEPYAITSSDDARILDVTIPASVVSIYQYSLNATFRYHILNDALKYPSGRQGYNILVAHKGSTTEAFTNKSSSSFFQDADDTGLTWNVGYSEGANNASNWVASYDPDTHVLTYTGSGDLMEYPELSTSKLAKFVPYYKYVNDVTKVVINDTSTADRVKAFPFTVFPNLTEIYSLNGDYSGFTACPNLTKITCKSPATISFPFVPSATSNINKLDVTIMKSGNPTERYYIVGKTIHFAEGITDVNYTATANTLVSNELILPSTLQKFGGRIQALNDIPTNIRFPNGYANLNSFVATSVSGNALGTIDPVMGSNITNLSVSGLTQPLKVVSDTYAYNYVVKNLIPYTVVDAVKATNMTLNRHSVYLMPGQTLQLSPTFTPLNTNIVDVAYSSSNTAVSTVDSNGVVTANAVGTATIYADETNGAHDECIIHVVNNLVQATGVDAPDATVTVGKTTKLAYTLTPTDTTDTSVSFKSADTSIATVSDTGVVSGVSLGTTTITITTNDGSNLSKTVNVTVVEPQALGLTVTADTEPTNDFVKLSARATGDVATLTLPSGVKVDASSFDYSVSKNGVYTFIATDTSGNKVTKTITVSNIDKVLPNLIVNSSYADDGTTYTINATDSESGIAKVTLPDGTEVVGADLPVTYKKTDFGDITISATDKAGNVTSKVYTRQAVTISGGTTTTMLAYEGIPTDWTNQDAKVTVAAYNPVDGVSLAAKLETTTSGVQATSNDVQSITTTQTDAVAPRSFGLKTPATTPMGASTLQTASLPKMLASGTSTTPVFQTVTMNKNGVINVTLTDGAGNTYNTTLDVHYIDKQAPNVTSTHTGNTYDVTATDSLSGVASITDPSGTVTNGNTVSYTDDTNATSLIFVVKDNAGNVTNYDAVTNKSSDDSTSGDISVIGGVDPSGSGSEIPATGEQEIDNGEVSVIIPTVIAFEITSDRHFVASDVTFKSNTARSVSFKVNSITPINGTTTAIVAPDAHADWSALTQAETNAGIALKLGGAWLNESGGVITTTAAKTDSTVVSTVPMEAKFGKNWGNSTKLILQYALSITIE